MRVSQMSEHQQDIRFMSYNQQQLTGSTHTNFLPTLQKGFHGSTVGHVDWCSSWVGGESGVGATGQQEAHHLHVVVFHSVMKRPDEEAESRTESIVITWRSLFTCSYSSCLYVILYCVSQLLRLLSSAERDTRAITFCFRALILTVNSDWHVHFNV